MSTYTPLFVTICNNYIGKNWKYLLYYKKKIGKMQEKIKRILLDI